MYTLQLINACVSPPYVWLLHVYHALMVVQGMFKASPIFNLAVFLHAVILEAAAWWLLWYFGNSWIVWIISGVVFAASQIQYGWQQHELVHGSVFNSTKLNHLFMNINLGLLQVSLNMFWLLIYSTTYNYHSLYPLTTCMTGDTY